MGMASDTPKLEVLLDRVVAGDRAAFRALYEATSPKLFAVAIRILRRSELAEEVLQETFLTIWDRAEQYRSAVSAPLTWMVAITRNRAIDVLRKRTAAPLPDDGAHLERASDLPDPYELTAQSAELRALLACMEGLEPRHRTCLLMAYYYGFTHEEIAERVDVPVGTVKSWLSRGLKRIRTCLDDD